MYRHIYIYIFEHNFSDFFMKKKKVQYFSSRLTYEKEINVTLKRIFDIILP
jgi:hypothetical protein